MATGRKSGAKRDAAALALASGQTIKEAAQACAVSERVIGYWLKEPAFVQRVDECRASMVEQAMSRLTRTMTQAADELAKLLKNRNARVRLSAAKTILESASRLRESTVIESRLCQLEELERRRQQQNERRQ